MTRAYRLRIAAPSGHLQVAVADPVVERRGMVLIAHPHPLHGGSLDNKVVQTLAKTFLALNYVAVRPNFRGVGASDGVHDHGKGEVEDMLAVSEFFHTQFDLPIALAGFSFGAYVQCQLSRRLSAERLVLVAPAVNMYDFGAAPDNTLVIHGERDELVPLFAVRNWAREQHAVLKVAPGTDHFFHGKLDLLKQLLLSAWQSSAPQA